MLYKVPRHCHGFSVCYPWAVWVDAALVYTHKKWYLKASSRIGSARSILFVMRLIPLDPWWGGHIGKNELDYWHSFNNGIHLVASFCALALLSIKHDTMLYLRKLSASCGYMYSPAPTLLYNPLPSGSAIAIRISSFFDFKYCPTPATVPPVPIHWFKTGINLQENQQEHTCPSDKGIHAPAGLSPDFRTSSQIMGVKIASVLKEVIGPQCRIDN